MYQQEKLERPRRLAYRPREKCIIAVSYILLCITLVMIGSQYPHVADTVPAHFNIHGEVDRWGDKREIFILIGVYIISVILPIILAHFPRCYNLPNHVNKENMEDVLYACRFVVLIMSIYVHFIFIPILYAVMAMKNPTLSWFGLWGLMSSIFLVVWSIYYIYYRKIYYRKK